MVSGNDKKDSTSADLPVVKFEYSEKKAKKIKIGIPKEYLDKSLNSEVRGKLESMIQFLKKNNFEVIDVSLPLTSKSISVYYILSTAEAASNLSRFDGVKYGFRTKSFNIKEMYKKTRSLGFGDEVKRRIILGTFILSSGYYDAYYGKALEVRRLIKNDFSKVFKNVDILLTPTSPYLPFKIGEKINDPIKMYLSDIYTVPMSLAGIPAMNIPFGLSKNKLPIGLQLSANHFKENHIFALSEFIRSNLN